MIEKKENTGNSVMKRIRYVNLYLFAYGWAPRQSKPLASIAKKYITFQVFHLQEILCHVCRGNSNLKGKIIRSKLDIRQINSTQSMLEKSGDFVFGIEYITVPCTRSASTRWTFLSALFLPMSYDAMREVFYSNALTACRLLVRNCWHEAP